MDKSSTRYQELSPVRQIVFDLVSDMETAFITGSYSRVLTSMTRHVPYASDKEFLLTSMRNMPTLGWSCWDMSVFLTYILEAQGIPAGVTIGFGAESGAPAVPHSLVKIIDDDNSVFYSDPYFGVGVIDPKLSDQIYWSSKSVHARMSHPERHPNTDVLHIAHKSHTRDYAYHILPGTLSEEQLQGALWQAETFGNSRRYIRGVGDGRIWLIKSHEGEDSTCLTWTHDYVIAPAETKIGSWFPLCSEMFEATSEDRQAAIDRIFRSDCSDETA